MIEIFYKLFMAGCLFLLSFCGLTIALSMWKKSKVKLCDICRNELDD